MPTLPAFPPLLARRRWALPGGTCVDVSESSDSSLISAVCGGNLYAVSTAGAPSCWLPGLAMCALERNTQCGCATADAGCILSAFLPELATGWALPATPRPASLLPAGGELLAAGGFTMLLPSVCSAAFDDAGFLWVSRLSVRGEQSANASHHPGRSRRPWPTWAVEQLPHEIVCCVNSTQDHPRQHTQLSACLPAFLPACVVQDSGCQGISFVRPGQLVAHLQQVGSGNPLGGVPSSKARWGGAPWH